MRCKQRVVIIIFAIVVMAVCWAINIYTSVTIQTLTPTHQSRHEPLRILPQDQEKKNISASNSIQHFSENIFKVISQLSKLQKEVTSPFLRQNLQQPIAELKKLLDNISTSTNIATQKDSPESKQSNAASMEGSDVCPEKFSSKDLSGGYPFFYKGFDMQNCTNVPAFTTLLTIVLNAVKTGNAVVEAILPQIHKHYPNIPILLAVDSQSYNKLNIKISPNVQIFSYKDSEPDTDVWNDLIGHVKTRYSLLARNLVHFSWHSRLERLVREITNLQATAVAGSYRYMDGQWNYGCQQTMLRNYTLVYKKGYDWSRHECMVCDSVQGPFVALTSTLTQHRLPAKMSSVSGFEVWFQEAKAHNQLVVSCPDSMFFVSQENYDKKESWLDLAKYYQVELIRTPATELRFDCTEANAGCAFSKGEALSHCCLNELSQMVKTFFHLCKEAGCLCELQEGTLLGAVKFNGILPWERDADVTFHSSNFTAIGKLSEKFRTAGYSLSTTREPWCCVDGVMAGGIYNLNSPNWHVEIYGQHLMDSEKLLLEHIPPTLVELDGALVPTPASPGLFSRNRYGYEIYQHAQHWMSLSQSSGWQFYRPGTFSPCRRPGHHSCLDQYLADGNIQFQGANP
ncbi:uncharacterized protein [Watersipora subatra]|uniref:uncharacterized protein n=1 Tax=Watersipora subatra TaxID=2589382 RepID=UPI00355B076C